MHNMTINSVWFRLKLAFQVFLRASAYRPFIDFGDFSIKNDATLVLKNKLKIHCLEDIEITSDKHVFISSGQTFDPGSELQYSLWFNTERDSEGRPLDEQGNIITQKRKIY